MAQNDLSSRHGLAGNEAILQGIAESLATLRYGEFVIKVHDSKIIQVERTEKTRYDISRCLEQGGGI